MQHRTLAALAALSLALACLPAAAQAQRSDTRGFSLGANLAGAALQFEDQTDPDSGSGIGLRVGYGVTQRFELFADLSGSAFEVPAGLTNYALGQIDLGARYNFRGAAAAARPYVSLAWATRVVVLENEEEMLEFASSGLSAGVGLRYFLSRRFALDAGLSVAGGDVTRARLNSGEWVDLEEESFGLTTSRLAVGISWHP
jgi:hypothetical protein